uniref:CMRF35-like molecule 8 n=2 Tax=Ailuropoda melanoleuca TaxID=9646 RepID=G1L3H5_AILME
MTPGDGRPWLPVALLLLQVPGCSSLSGPNSAAGTVGGSLSVQCRYEDKFRENAKYWCKNRCVWKIVETKAADREVRKGHVSIRDHRADLTFTVTLENLTESDAGTYWCGIDTPSLPGYFRDPVFRIVVSVSPGELCTPPPPAPAPG